MSDEIVLYDLACKGKNASWSGNVWRTRLALNYKSLPYRTEWLHHANLGERLSPIVPEPNKEGASYTVPVVKFPNGAAVMSSETIAKRLEQDYPSPSLHIEEALLRQLDGILAKVARPLAPVFMPRVAREKLVDESVPYFQQARAAAFGMSLDELEKTRGGDGAWQAAEPGIRELAAFLKQHKKDDGPFTLGSHVSYVDFVIVALLEGFRNIGQDIFERFVSVDESLGKLHQACGKWIERND